MTGNIYNDKQLADVIRRAILGGKYKPRERLVEAALSDEYHVSRTPIREAIKQLEAMGLVVHTPNKGAVVADIDLERIHEMHLVRACLEGFVCKLAAERCSANDILALERYIVCMEEATLTGDIEVYSKNNSHFHDYINECCGNIYLIESINNILKLTVHRASTTWRGLGNTEQINCRHREILDALKAGDADKARIVGEQHVLDAVKNLVNSRDAFQ